MSIGRPDATEVIRSLVAGLNPSLHDRQVFWMLQAYIDDSRGADPPLFVLAGYAASVDQWLAFSEKWERAVKYSWRLPSFRMSEAAQWPEDIKRERLGYLNDVIYEHVAAHFALSFDMRSLERVFTDFPERDFRNAYCFGFYLLVQYLLVKALTRGNEHISLIFHHQEDVQEWLRAGWNRFMATAPAAAKERLFEPPRFLPDNVTPPLQAADFIAWHIRRRVLEDVYGCEKQSYPWIERRKKRPGFVNYLTEDALWEMREHILREQLARMIIHEEDGTIGWRIGGRDVVAEIRLVPVTSPGEEDQS